MKLKNWILKHKVITAIIAVILAAIIGVGIYSIKHPIVIYLGLEPTPSAAEPSATPTATPTPTPAPTPEATAPSAEAAAVDSEFPVGTFVTEDSDGRAYYLTIDSAGTAVLDWTSARGPFSETYTMRVDDTVTVPSGVTAYLLINSEGVTDRGMTYSSTDDTLTDAAPPNSVWTRVE